jgi:S1/P1 Nuclease
VAAGGSEHGTHEVIIRNDSARPGSSRAGGCGGRVPASGPVGSACARYKLACTEGGHAAHGHEPPSLASRCETPNDSPGGLITSENLNGEAGGTPDQWANESLRLAQAAWVQDGTNLDEHHYREQINVVDRQMALAGLRLAKLLNGTIGKMTPRDFR